MLPKICLKRIRNVLPLIPTAHLLVVTLCCRRGKVTLSLKWYKAANYSCQQKFAIKAKKILQQESLLPTEQSGAKYGRRRKNK
jgi:hypothetical protein